MILRTRILSASVALILLLVIMFLIPELFGAAVFILALVSMYEFYGSVSSAGYKPVKIIGYISCLFLLAVGYGFGEDGIAGFLNSVGTVRFFSFSVFALILFLMAVIVFLHDKYNLIDISLTIFGILYVVFLFSFVILTRSMENGKYFIWLIFIGAWATDTFAYFTGVALGKTKLAPAVSPKKTVEGSAGGVVACVAIMLLYGLLIVNRDVNPIPVYHYIVIGILCGIVSQIGDLAASAIKRYVKIKDYGSIMPGHGGILDRFDSILFVAPVVYFYINIFI